MLLNSYVESYLINNTCLFVFLMEGLLMKTVGIITLPGNFNYGNRLQCYAMVSAVRNCHCNPVVIERERPLSIFRNSLHQTKMLVEHMFAGNSFDDPEKMRSEERAKSFDNFATLLPIKRFPGKGYSALNYADCFVVGSDQVWNPYEYSHQERWYFAEFARSKQCFAVAASLGIDDFSNPNQPRRLLRGVKSFDNISVREKRGAELLKEYCGLDADVVCDPTLVLSAESWRSIADNRCTPAEPYVFTYLLGGVGVEASVILDNVTGHGCMPVVPLSDRQKPGEPDAGPAEFIDLIDHATHVVTDSFHAAVFSSILHTPLTIVHREGGASMFSRLEQLSEMLGIQEKVYGSDPYDISRAGDYDGVDDAIDRERDKFMDYLEGCLNG